jgi:hypothetical protein
MNENSNHNTGLPTSDNFGNVPNHAEPFRHVPNDSEAFGSVPHHAESFRTFPKLAERREDHTLTVREAARLFEAAGVARTERSIINWCQPNKMGVARLDHYFDPNERKYFISPQSVEAAIQEEKAKAMKGLAKPNDSETVPKDSETLRKVDKSAEGAPTGRIAELEKEVLDLKITNRAKDYFIENLKQQQESFTTERNHFIDQLMASNRRVGELETKLLQIEAPRKIEVPERGGSESVSVERV